MRRFIFLLALLLIPLTYAGAVNNFDYEITEACLNLDCAETNITVLWPNNSVMINNERMTNNYDRFVNYTFNSDVLGNYEYLVYDNTDANLTIHKTLKVSNTGYEATEGQATFYQIVVLVVLTLLAFCLYMAVTIPYKNYENTVGETIRINWLKYAKFFFIGATYMLIVGLTFISYNLVYAYSDWYGLANWLRYLWTLEFILFFPALVIGFVMVAIKFFSDRNISKFTKGLGAGHINTGAY